MDKKVVIVGGGFAGIAAAKKLADTGGIHVTLISNQTHFEYYPAIYRVLSGWSPAGVCIRYDEIFDGTNVEVVQDKIISWESSEKKLIGESGSHYLYDYTILAFGSETVFFGVEGMGEFAYSFKSIS